MSIRESPEQSVEQSGPDWILPIMIGVLALAIVPAALVWVATHIPPSSEAHLTAFPEDSFPARGFSLSEYHREMEVRLHGLRWVDRDKGIAQVPIELGMQLILAHKLPARDGVPAGGQQK
jgi:hypothetical protein